MKSLTVQFMPILIALVVSLTSCGPKANDLNALAAAKKSKYEKKFDARVADLIAKKTDVNEVRDKGIPILCWAVEHDYVDATRVLLENGADPNTRMMKGAYDTALFATVSSLSYGNNALEARRMKNSKAIAELFIKHGVDVKYEASSMKTTVLHKAALRGRADLCELFIANGAKVNAVNGLGNTPLHRAAKGGYWETVQLLLKNGAMASIKDKFSKTALDLAKEKDDESLNLEIRKETKLDYNPASDYDKTIQILSK